LSISTIENNLEVRRIKHPGKDLGTAGSYFKNIPPKKEGERRIAAGYILERAGAKGIRKGDAGVFEKHANMIVNYGNATAAEVLEVAQEMKRLARENYGIILEEEVRFVGREM
jgi:UDP-N-acetylmuramate dehydrogenase